MFKVNRLTDEKGNVLPVKFTGKYEVSIAIPNSIFGGKLVDDSKSYTAGSENLSGIAEAAIDGLRKRTVILKLNFAGKVLYFSHVFDFDFPPVCCYSNFDTSGLSENVAEDMVIIVKYISSNYREILG